MMLEEQKYNPDVFLNNFIVENQDKCTGMVSYGNDLVFKYIDFKKINQDDCGVSFQDIFKFNMECIITQLSEYFPKILIFINYDEPNRNETLIKDWEKTIKHDTYIRFEYDGEYFDCGFDFIKKDIIINNYRYISSQVNLDYYKYFDEDCDSLNIFMSDCIRKLLTIICAISNDEFKLAEIMFADTNRELENLQVQIGKFRKIIYGKKEGKMDFNEYYGYICPIDEETGEDMCKDQFIQYIESNVFEGKKIKFINNQFLSWDDFELIVIKLNSNISLNNIDTHKIVYIQATNTLMSALKTIIELIKQINKTKKYIPQYIDNFLSNDIENYSNKELLKNVYLKLDNLFSDNKLNSK